MKKLLASVFICVGIFMLTACSSPMSPSGKRQNGLNCPFSGKMTVSLDKMTAEGTIARLGEGKWEAEFESPNTLSGVKLSFDGSSVEASYKGLSFSVPKSAIPVKAMLVDLISAVDSAAQQEELQGSENEGYLSIFGSLEGGDYTLTVDGSGSLHSFEMPNNQLKIAFEDIMRQEVSVPETEPQTECSTY